MTTVTPAWVFTDDPSDPCGYDVGWLEADDDPLGEKALPVWPDGSVVSRLYRFVHANCQARVIAYTSESEARE